MQDFCQINANKCDFCRLLRAFESEFEVVQQNFCKFVCYAIHSISHSSEGAPKGRLTSYATPAQPAPCRRACCEDVTSGLLTLTVTADV